MGLAPEDFPPQKLPTPVAELDVSNCVECPRRIGAFTSALVRWNCFHPARQRQIDAPSEFAPEFGIPVWLALITMLTQLIGAILLILGALTLLAALGIAGTMITATIFLINHGEPFINPTGHSWKTRLSI